MLIHYNVHSVRSLDIYCIVRADYRICANLCNAGSMKRPVHGPGTGAADEEIITILWLWIGIISLYIHIVIMGPMDNITPCARGNSGHEIRAIIPIQASDLDIIAALPDYYE